jgi:hypothetical protein
VKPPRSVVPPVCHEPHAEIVIGGHRGAVGLRNIERIADMIAVPVGQHDMRHALDRCGSVGDEGRIAGEKRIDQDRMAGKIQSKRGVTVPGDLHDGTLRLPEAGCVRP